MMQNKLALLKELQSNTFVCLRPSLIHGIGVFALCEIPKGTKNLFAEEEGEWIELSFEEVANLPHASRHLIETYCLFNDSHYYVPAHGFKAMDLSLFLNHSDQPNVKSIEDGKFFETLRTIQSNEELLIDYGTIVESSE